MSSSVLNRDKKIRYQVLDRMKQEVSYCIRHIEGRKEDGDQSKRWDRFLANHLSSGEESQFADMTDLLVSFGTEDQPDWYSLGELRSDKSRLEDLVGKELG